MGENQAREQRIGELVLRFDPATFELKITGSVQNLDMALSMLRQATDELESQKRAAAARSALTIAPGALPGFMRQKPQ
jgi:small neutral amino acid transporter SnatA (MarC family)